MCRNYVCVACTCAGHNDTCVRSLIAAMNSVHTYITIYVHITITATSLDVLSFETPGIQHTHKVEPSVVHTHTWPHDERQVLKHRAIHNWIVDTDLLQGEYWIRARYCDEETHRFRKLQSPQESSTHSIKGDVKWHCIATYSTKGHWLLIMMHHTIRCTLECIQLKCSTQSNQIIPWWSIHHHHL